MRFASEVGEHAACSLKHIGRSAVLPLRRRFRQLAIACDPAEIRQQIRESCPAHPGVYAFVDRDERVVYVGVSSKLRKRLITYFQGGSALRKEQAVAGQATRVTWQVVGHEFVAQLRELELIRRFQPRLNVRGRWPGKPLGYIYLSAEDAPRFRVARRVPKGFRQFWGPLAMGWRIRDAVELINQLFKLCDCPATTPMHFADQRHLFSLDLRLGCLRGETGSCLGPCAGRCTFTEYATQLAAARAFLDGRDESLLTELEQRLSTAAGLYRFEQAARLRDMLESLRGLTTRLARLREPPTPSEFIYRLPLGRHPVWFFVVGGVVTASAKAPVSIEQAKCCLTHLGVAYDKGITQRSDADRLGAQIVSAWFYSRPDESVHIFSPDEARARCQALLRKRHGQ